MPAFYTVIYNTKEWLGNEITEMWVCFFFMWYDMSIWKKEFNVILETSAIHLITLVPACLLGLT